MDWLKRVHGGPGGAQTVDFRPGDQVRVWCRIQERGRVRTAPFEGTVIRLRGSGASRTFTVRRVTFGEGVERVFPLAGRLIDRIEVLRRGKVSRSRLYYLRTVIGKVRIASEGGSAAEKPANVPATAEEPTGSLHVPS